LQQLGFGFRLTLENDQSSYAVRWEQRAYEGLTAKGNVARGLGVFVFPRPEDFSELDTA
jgi:hypothetical protein